MLFAEYTGIKVKQFRETLLLQMGNVKKFVTERTLGQKSDEHITSSCLGTYITHVVDAYIKPVNDQEPSAEVHLTAQHNVLANEQHHTNQSKPSYDTYLLEKVDSNITSESTNMFHRGGEIDQDAEQDQVKSSLLKAEFLKMNDMVEKEVYNELLNRFLQLEKHCISLEISIQQKEESFQSNKPCKNQDSPEFRKFLEINELKALLQAKNSTINNLKKQIKNVLEKSNEAKVKHGIDVIETINIELEHKVAKLLKGNETLKEHYKDLYDSIKVNSRAKDQSPKSRNNIKPANRIPNVNKSERWISKGYRFSPNKSSTVHEKPNTLRYCLRWKPTGRIFKTVGLRWIPTVKMFVDCITKVDSEPLNGSNNDITNLYECDQTLNVSADTLNLSAGLALHRQMASADNTSGPIPQRKEKCMLQCALFLKEEKSSYLRAVLSTTSICSHARLVNKWINVH
nr:hypothetical protein [Tanacetum cinerariifolium]